jgi:integrase
MPENAADGAPSRRPDSEPAPAGLRSMRIHDARHTRASLLIASGADIVAVSW